MYYGGFERDIEQDKFCHFLLTLIRMQSIDIMQEIVVVLLGVEFRSNILKYTWHVSKMQSNQIRVDK